MSGPVMIEGGELGAMGLEGSAISMAEHLEIDAVIDPANTRSWLIAGLSAAVLP